MAARITHIGNEGFGIVVGGTHVFIDAFYVSLPGVAEPAVIQAEQIRTAHLILITHAHPDHFSPAKVAHVAQRTGAVVMGPRAAIERLRDRLPNMALVEIDPIRRFGVEPAACHTVEFPGVRVTAFRTFHARDHNSYLVELNGFRFFHDGDNEDTRRVPLEALGRLDALLIGPWRNSGWPQFARAAAARRTFLMHLTDAEVSAHEDGRFLTDICPEPPPDLTALRRGASFLFK